MCVKSNDSSRLILAFPHKSREVAKLKSQTIQLRIKSFNELYFKKLKKFEKSNFYPSSLT